MISGRPLSTDSSRRRILDRLRSRVVSVSEIPELRDDRLTKFVDPAAKFAEMVGAVGGEVHWAASLAEVESLLATRPEFRDARRIASTVAGLPGSVDLADVDDPHSLASLDWTIAGGAFGVAENGAVWIEGKTVKHRVALFITQYLALVVSRSAIVNNMHEAYRRIGTPPAGFGVFVSGPSKTADIEQSLVLGAHGCRTLQVFLLP